MSPASSVSSLSFFLVEEVRLSGIHREGSHDRLVLEQGQRDLRPETQPQDFLQTRSAKTMGGDVIIEYRAPLPDSPPNRSFSPRRVVPGGRLGSGKLFRAFARPGNGCHVLRRRIEDADPGKGELPVLDGDAAGFLEQLLPVANTYES